MPLHYNSALSLAALLPFSVKSLVSISSYICIEFAHNRFLYCIVEDLPLLHSRSGTLAVNYVVLRRVHFLALE